MAKINCFHCNAEIDLVNTTKGKNKCPNCKKTFKIHNSRTEFENIVMAPSDNNVNKFENVVNAPNDNNLNNVIVLPKSIILGKNIKVILLFPLGVISLCYGLVMLFNGAGAFTGVFGRQGGGGLLDLMCGLWFVLLGVYLLLPAITYSSDIENKKLEYHLKTTNQILPNQSITNPSKSIIKILLESSIILTIIGFVTLFVMSGGLLLFIYLIAYGSGGAFG